MENNIPPPLRVKYPFLEMKVGDSFFIQTKDVYRTQVRIWSAIYRLREFKKDTTSNFTTHIERKEECGVRVWKIS